MIEKKEKKSFLHGNGNGIEWDGGRKGGLGLRLSFVGVVRGRKLEVRK